MSSKNFTDFIGMHRELLECYAEHMNPVYYKTLQPADQRDFCYVQRVRLEESLIKGTVKKADFFAAARESRA